jgi:signal peptide peptidase SppA
MYSIIDAVMSAKWAIIPEHLETIMSIAGRDNLDIAAVEKELGRKLNNTRGEISMRSGVAVIPVHGPIIRYASIFSDISGATSIENLAQDFNAALESSEVDAIILDIDSPGGEVNGTSEFANMIREARGRKPIVAYAGGLMASAAYWIGSAADEIVAQDTAILGSIGVVATMRKSSTEGINCDGSVWKDYEFVSSQSPDKRPDVSTDDGQLKIQTEVDALAQVFVEAVADQRSVSVKTVLADFGQGGVQVGQAAVKSGLADSLGSLESVIEELRSSGTSSTTISTPTSNKGSDSMNREQLDAKHPELVQEITAEAKASVSIPNVDQIKADAKAEALSEERGRIAAINALPLAGHSDLVQAAIENGDDASQLAIDVLNADAALREVVKDDIKDDRKEAALETSGAEADADVIEADAAEDVDDSDLSPEDKQAKTWEANAEVDGIKPQDEFSSLEEYQSYEANAHRVRK